MKKYLAIPALLIALLVLPGCEATRNFTEAVSRTVAVATKSFDNPATPTNLYQAKVAFAGGQELVLKYQRDCFGSEAPPYPVTFARIKSDPALFALCSHRVSRYNAMKVAEGRANAAITAADGFIARNPNGNAVTYIQAAVRAVTDYKTAAGG